MSDFSTTDLYLAAYMRMYCVSMNKRKAGDKIIFEFTFDPDVIDAESLQAEFYEDEKAQRFVSAIKEVRNDIYKTMRK